VDPVEYVTLGWRDPAYPFEKNEPHPLRKTVEGKWRIVNCLSLVDQVVERVFFNDCLLPIKRAYPESSAVIGIGFSDDHLKLFGDQVMKDMDPSRSSSEDVSGWERSLTENLIMETASYCVHDTVLTNRTVCTKLVRATNRMAKMMTNPMFVISSKNGQYLECVLRCKPGGMLSGSFLTTLFNTISRLILAYQCGATDAKAAGDDSLTQSDMSLEEKRLRYLDRGFVLRDLEPFKENGFNFCSHDFRRKESGRWEASLSSWPKAFYNALTRELTSERVSNFIDETRHNSNTKELLSILMKYGHHPKDRSGL